MPCTDPWRENSTVRLQKRISRLQYFKIQVLLYIVKNEELNSIDRNFHRIFFTQGRKIRKFLGNDVHMCKLHLKNKVGKEVCDAANKDVHSCSFIVNMQRDKE